MIIIIFIDVICFKNGFFVFRFPYSHIYINVYMIRQNLGGQPINYIKSSLPCLP